MQDLNEVFSADSVLCLNALATNPVSNLFMGDEKLALVSDCDGNGMLRPLTTLAFTSHGLSQSNCSSRSRSGRRSRSTP